MAAEEGVIVLAVAEVLFGSVSMIWLGAGALTKFGKPPSVRSSATSALYSAVGALPEPLSFLLLPPGRFAASWLRLACSSDRRSAIAALRFAFAVSTFCSAAFPGLLRAAARAASSAARAFAIACCPGVTCATALAGLAGAAFTDAEAFAACGAGAFSILPCLIAARAVTTALFE